METYRTESGHIIVLGAKEKKQLLAWTDLPEAWQNEHDWADEDKLFVCDTPSLGSDTCKGYCVALENFKPSEFSAVLAKHCDKDEVADISGLSSDMLGAGQLLLAPRDMCDDGFVWVVEYYYKG